MFLKNNREFLKDFAAITGVILFCALCFYRYFLLGESIFTFGSNVSVNPIKYITATKLINGGYPFWIPYLYGGTPLYSGVGILDIFQYFHAILPPLDAFIVGTFSMICLGSLGMYFLMRNCFFCGRLSSLVGAASLGASPFAGTRLIEPFFLMPYLVLPWIFYCLYLSVKKKTLFWAAVGALPFSITYFSGSIQSTAFIALFLCFFVLCNWTVENTVESGSKNGTFMVKAMIVLFCFSGLLMAVEVIPMLELITISRVPPVAENVYVWKSIVIFSLIFLYFVIVVGLRRILKIRAERAYLYALIIPICLLLGGLFLKKGLHDGMSSWLSYFKLILSRLFFVPSNHFSDETFNYFGISYWLRAITLAIVVSSFFLKKNIETIIFLAIIVGYSLFPHSLFNPDFDRLAFIPIFSLTCVISLTMDRLFKLHQNV